jgi:hypothetical protein
VDDVSSIMYLFAGLAFRYAWIYAGTASAADDAAAAAMGRGGDALDSAEGERRQSRARSSRRSPLPVLPAVHRAYGEAIGRTSLAIERLVRRRPAG